MARCDHDFDFSLRNQAGYTCRRCGVYFRMCLECGGLMDGGSTQAEAEDNHFCEFLEGEEPFGMDGETVQ